MVGTLVSLEATFRRRGALKPSAIHDPI